MIVPEPSTTRSPPTPPFTGAAAAPPPPAAEAEAEWEESYMAAGQGTTGPRPCDGLGGKKVEGRVGALAKRDESQSKRLERLGWCKFGIARG